MRTRLQIEYLRLLDWSKVAGLIELSEGDNYNFPESLRTDRLVLVAVLAEIRTLMEDFSEINGRYAPLKFSEESTARRKVEQLKLAEDFQ